MEYNLREFAGAELKKYTVIRELGGSLHAPEGKKKKFEFEMLIYKATLKGVSRNLNDGGRSTGQLNGKSFKADKLEQEDTVIVEGDEYTVANILPRIYSDFVEFTLELKRNGE